MEKKRMIERIQALILTLLSAASAAGCFGLAWPRDGAKHYADLLFDSTRVHTIEVFMSEEDRAEQLAHPKDKTKFRADVVIDGVMKRLRAGGSAAHNNGGLHDQRDSGSSGRDCSGEIPFRAVSRSGMLCLWWGDVS